MKRAVLLVAVLVVLVTVGLAQAEPVIREVPFSKRTALTVPGRYDFEFRLWTSASPDDPLGEMVWSEQKSIRLRTRTLRHLLGSVTPFSDEGTSLGPVDFSRQLWVEVARASGGIYTALPGRTRFALGPYALYSESAGSLPAGSVTGEMLAGGAVSDAKVSGPISGAKIDGVGLSADMVDGLHAADLGGTVPHDHDAAYVNDDAGEVADPDVPVGALSANRISGTAWTAANDGSGSMLDADTVDGSHAAGFAASSHVHAGEAITSGTVADARVAPTIARDSEVMPAVLAADGAGSTLDSDTVDGLHAADLGGTAPHDHDAAYVNAVGDTMTGALVLDTAGGANLSLAEGELSRGGDLTVDALNPAAASTVSVLNSDASQVANLSVEGAVSAASFTGDGSGLTNITVGDADTVDGSHAVAFAASSHVHAGEAITSGTVADARVAPTITRDTEVMPTVLAADGAGSTLDADLLDGAQASSFAAVAHVHAGEAITSGTVADTHIAATIARDSEVVPTVLAADGAGSTLDADLLDGLHAAEIAAGTHNHDDLYDRKAYVATLEARIAALETLLAGVTRVANEIYVDGANVHIRNGGNETRAINGLGNLIVGYNELREVGINDRSGSHNIVVGTYNNFSSYGGLVIGYYNTITGIFASVTGGCVNTASGYYSSVSGGAGNRASLENSSVSGGLENIAGGWYSSVSGGNNNKASGWYSSISGGANNMASGDYSSVTGGGGPNSADGNEAFGNYTAILGGEANLAGDENRYDRTLGQGATASGGYQNRASGAGSSVGGGSYNRASGYMASVSSGQSNTSSGANASIGGGHANLASGDNASVGGGDNNTASGLASTVAGGGGPNSYEGNEAFGNYTAILGGQTNLAGDPNRMDRTVGQQATVGGGLSNKASGTFASVSGGGYNTASGAGASAGGGYVNTADGSYSSVGGGQYNQAQGTYGVVSGGRYNFAGGESSSVSGGTNNSATGAGATVSGGYLRGASGWDDWVAGGYWQEF